MTTQTKGSAAAGERRSSQDAPLRLDDFLPYQLNVVASLVSQALSRLYAERYGIGVPEWRVLVTLGEFETMTGKAIGEHSHMHKTKVSRAVALLEKRKFLVRRVNRSDLRESFLSLTPEGRAIYDDLAPGCDGPCPPPDRSDRPRRPRGLRARAVAPDRAGETAGRPGDRRSRSVAHARHGAARGWTSLSPSRLVAKTARRPGKIL